MTLVNRKEIYRYLGYHGVQPDPRTDTLIEEILKELEQLTTFRMIHRIVPVTLHEEDQITLGPIETRSHSLTRNLAGCTQAILLGATLGSDIDRKLKVYERLDMTKAVILQAASSALIEAELDDKTGILFRELQTQGLYPHPRFSPGYGDLPLALQPQFLAVLEMSKRIGVTLTDGLLMIPSKSVTAIIGLSTTPHACPVTDCMNCDKTDCEFRRE